MTARCRAAVAALLTACALLVPGTALADTTATAPTPGIGSSAIGIPGVPVYLPGTLGSRDARIVYLHAEREIARANEIQKQLGVPVEARARVGFEMRNALRAYTRRIMADRATALGLDRTDPNMTWEQITGRYRARGLDGPALFEAIAESASKSRRDIDRQFDLDPANLPPLPAMRLTPAA
ncbi:hypothetical protein [Rhodococcus sp. SGAir0479]|uniref:hypothetical protein n=1 Tax=Rhodococcus sp. SGAir0479 TaxID=2567884 RepID=UPI0010CCDE0D|nr:hypothetical protein [Rhodococcus sp. SGAir0479]QCQ93641.1 hypothetical protein E7742_22105 [Rhodococcus sp. SGAir0479]